MHHYWAYGFAVIVIILLLIAAALIAYEDNKEDNRKKVHFEHRQTPVVQLPLDFGAL